MKMTKKEKELLLKKHEEVLKKANDAILEIITKDGVKLLKDEQVSLRISKIVKKTLKDNKISIQKIFDDAINEALKGINKNETKR